MTQDTERGNGLPRRLPIVRIDNVCWFVDVRLRQFRDVTNPHNYVDFDSDAGERMFALGRLTESLRLGQWPA